MMNSGFEPGGRRHVRKPRDILVIGPRVGLGARVWLHGQPHLPRLGIDVRDPDLHGLTNLDLIGWVLYEPLPDLRDVHHSSEAGAPGRGRHHHEEAKVRDPGHGALQPLLRGHVHEARQVGRFATGLGLGLHHAEVQFPFFVDSLHPDLHRLAGVHEVCRVVHEGVRHPRDVHEAIAVGADVHEAAEGRGAEDEAVQLLASRQVLDAHPHPFVSPLPGSPRQLRSGAAALPAGSASAC
mmetsp:Transcript_78278/g.207750  ORF Transcript_78278/g.207750 Transcript_78278/m.207750 type:complete len:238 (+) Transcript_78278:299-1012(+)